MNNKTVSGAMKKLLAVTCAFTLILGAAPVLGSTVLDAPALVVSANDEDPAPDLSGKNYISGCSVTLGGEIGLNIEVTVNAPEAFDSVYIAMHDSPYKPLEIPKSELAKYKIGEGEQGVTYKFTYYIAPMDIGRKITFKLNKDNTGTELYDSKGNPLDTTSYFQYSVTDYIDYFNQNKENFDSETIALVNALKVYGETANYYFSNCTGAKPNFDVTGFTVDKVADHKFKADGEVPSTLEGSALFIDSKTSYRVYFSRDPGEVKLGDKVLEVHTVEKEIGADYYVEVPGISAQDLDKTFTLTFSNGSTVSFSALSYVYAAYNKYGDFELEEGSDADKVRDALLDTCKALYAYNFAANMYADKKYSGSTLSEEDLVLAQSLENENVYTFSYGGETYTAKYTPNGANWQIVNSYKITNTKDMLVICEALSRLHPIKGCLTPYRAAADMVDEWVIHNHVYSELQRMAASTNFFIKQAISALSGKFGQAIESTQSVDINTPDQGKTEMEFLDERIGSSTVELLQGFGFFI